MSAKVGLAAGLAALAGAGGLGWLARACNPDQDRVRVHGFVWDDLDGNGLVNNESGVAGVRVTLRCGLDPVDGGDPILQPCFETETEDNGFYEFDGFYEPDEATVVQIEVSPDGGRSFTPRSNVSAVDPATGRSDVIPIELFIGDEGGGLKIDAGLLPAPPAAEPQAEEEPPPTTIPATAGPPPVSPPAPVSAAPEPVLTGVIGDLVWYDQDGDALQDPGEVNAEFRILSVTLFDQSGATVATTNVDAAGGYQFTGLAAGTYRVQFSLPGNGRFAFVAPDAGDDTLDSDVDPVTGAVEVTLGIGETNATIDAGIEFTG
jgi:hypothetical protein